MNWRRAQSVPTSSIHRGGCCKIPSRPTGANGGAPSPSSNCPPPHFPPAARRGAPRRQPLRVSHLAISAGHDLHHLLPGVVVAIASVPRLSDRKHPGACSGSTPGLDRRLRRRALIHPDHELLQAAPDGACPCRVPVDLTNELQIIARFGYLRRRTAYTTAFGTCLWNLPLTTEYSVTTITLTLSLYIYSSDLPGDRQPGRWGAYGLFLPIFDSPT